jgi:isopenicillin N synthase-like dioxygenase
LPTIRPTSPATSARAFRQFGFAMVKDHGVDDALINRAWDLTEQFFALPEDEKRAYFLANGGARGYTPSRPRSPRAPRVMI